MYNDGWTNGPLMCRRSVSWQERRLEMRRYCLEALDVAESVRRCASQLPKFDGCELVYTALQPQAAMGKAQPLPQPPPQREPDRSGLATAQQPATRLATHDVWRLDRRPLVRLPLPMLSEQL